MADHVYRVNEVPKGQRWQYFLDYYKYPVLILLLVVVVVISIIKSVFFAPETDVSILAVTNEQVESTFWDETIAAMSAMPLDFDGDEQSLVKFYTVTLNETMKQNEGELYAANQNKLMATLASATCALQIVDETNFALLQEENLLGTYAELPSFSGHLADEIIKIPLDTLAPFKALDGLPEGLYMTLRPQSAMQIGNSEKKLARYKDQVKALMTMIELEY